MEVPDSYGPGFHGGQARVAEQLDDIAECESRRDRIYFTDMPPSPFHSLIERWFAERIGEPTSAQRRGWDAIRSGAHTLIAAPTGSGKLPLLMRGPTIADLPALDTTGLHVAAIIERLRA